MRKQNKPTKEKPKKTGIQKLDELLAGSMDVEFMPDGRIKRKGSKGKGTELNEHTFYAC